MAHKTGTADTRPKPVGEWLRKKIVGTAMSETIEMLVEMQQHIAEFRRLAASRRFDAFTAKLLNQLADEVEARARKFDDKKPS